jgi:hypothetical protein
MPLCEKIKDSPVFGRGGQEGLYGLSGMQTTNTGISKRLNTANVHIAECQETDTIKKDTEALIAYIRKQKA